MHSHFLERHLFIQTFFFKSQECLLAKRPGPSEAVPQPWVSSLSLPCHPTGFSAACSLCLGAPHSRLPFPWAPTPSVSPHAPGQCSKVGTGPGTRLACPAFQPPGQKDLRQEEMNRPSDAPGPPKRRGRQERKSLELNPFFGEVFSMQRKTKQRSKQD